MKLRIAMLALSAGVLSSCGLMVDNTFAPPPIAAEEGDLFIDATASALPEVQGGSENRISFLPALGLGVGYALTNQDFVYANYQLNYFDNFALSTTARYQRKLNLTGSIEHFIGGQYQYAYSYFEDQPDREAYSNGAHALGISYFGRLNSPGAVQPYLGLQLGAGVLASDFDVSYGMSTLAVGVQYRFADAWECRLEINQNLGFDLDDSNSEWGGGLTASFRYIFH
ncbi:hypothetical protein [Phaeocystidibacter luteus]|uniref:Porin family protein n=1 Tax=Phaeocystidibacter luteus TaxID=911197 RepID=A0A6N6RGZ4_9FLAO|nr:hypothetical protein [Phaeocystidibacter luteus]KAB2810383.1 hypothetical protein F8C67_07285 [Phaeocystidibacter luteus]